MGACTTRRAPCGPGTAWPARPMLYAFCESHGVAAPALRQAHRGDRTTRARRSRASRAGRRQRGRGPALPRRGRGPRPRTEPRLHAALLSPRTGIVDSHAFMLALQGDLEDAGGAIAFDTPVEGSPGGGGLGRPPGGGEPGESRSSGGQRRGPRGAGVARATEAYPPTASRASSSRRATTSAARPARLLAADLSGARRRAASASHLTLDLAGRMRFGPDVEWVDREDYGSIPARADSFYASIRRYWPGLPDGSLVPDYAGIRPKLTGPGEKAADFVIDGPGGARAPRAGPSLRHREPGPDFVPVPGRRRRGSAGRRLSARSDRRNTQGRGVRLTAG